jgi:hypothetical protein
MMKKHVIAASIAALTFSIGQTAHAEADTDTGVPHTALQLLLGGGLTFGGDDILKAQYTNGAEDEMEAGGLIDLKAGFRYQAPDSSLVAQATVGYFFDSVNAKNGDAEISRIPLEALAFFNFGNHLLGGGVTYHTSNNTESDFAGASFDEDFKDAAGLVVEYGYKVSPQATVAIRLVDIDYEFESTQTVKVDASHVGLYGYLHF